MYLSPYNYANSLVSQAQFSPQNNRNEIISTVFPSCELPNKYSERVKEFTPSAVFGIQNGGEGKMGVKTFIVEPLPPPRLRDET